MKKCSLIIGYFLKKYDIKEMGTKNIGMRRSKGDLVDMKKFKKILLMIIMVIFLTGCDESDVTEQITNVVQAEDPNVVGVKNGTNSEYPNMTYGEAFESFFAAPTWKYFKGTKNGPDDDGDGKPDYVEENVDIVEFTGYCTYHDVEVKALIQFTLNNNEGTFQATYLSFNEVPQSNLIMWALIEKAFTNDVEETVVVEKNNSETQEETTSEFMGEMGKYVSWDNGYGTYLTFNSDNDIIYYMSFETEIVSNYLDGWEGYHKGDGKTIAIDTYYGKGEQGQIEFIWETPTSLLVQVNGSTGYSDEDFDYDVDRLLNGRRFTLTEDTVSMNKDSNSFVGVDGYYMYGSEFGDESYGCVTVTLNQPYAYIEMQKGDGEYIFQMEAEYVDESMLISQWENGATIYFYWEDAGTLLIRSDKSTDEAELDWMLEKERYWNSEYHQTS